jgi:hypothetical protein
LPFLPNDQRSSPQAPGQTQGFLGFLPSLIGFQKITLPFQAVAEKTTSLVDKSTSPYFPMLKILKISPKIWIDEYNVIYKKISSTAFRTSEGRTLRAPRPGEKIFLDGRGNGILFS